MIFENGWASFRDNYSITVGYFLIFGFDGDSHFDVDIFDTSCNGIDYPSDEAEDDVDIGKGKSVATASRTRGECSARKGAKGEGNMYRKVNEIMQAMPSSVTAFVEEMDLSSTSHNYGLSFPMETTRKFFEIGHHEIKWHV